MEAMTWASALTYDSDRKSQDGLSCKSSVEKKKTHGNKQQKPFAKGTRDDNRRNREESTTTN